MIENRLYGVTGRGTLPHIQRPEWVAGYQIDPTYCFGTKGFSYSHFILHVNPRHYQILCCSGFTLSARDIRFQPSLVIFLDELFGLFHQASIPHKEGRALV